MIGIDRHLVVLGCGLVATAMLAFGGGLATATWLATAPALCEPPPGAGQSGDAGQAAARAAQETVAAAVEFADDMPGGSQPAPAPGLRTVTGGAAFQVQVGSFLDQEVAGAIAVHLAGRGYQASVETRTDRTGLVWYAPVIGAYDKRGIAAEAAREVARRVGLAARVVPVATDDVS